MSIRTSLRVFAATAAVTFAAAMPAFADTTSENASPTPTNSGDASVAKAGARTFTIANITDFHGRIGGTGTNDAGVSGVATGPAVRLACYLEESGAYLTSSGDNIGATLFTSAAEEDHPTIDILNTLGLKVSSVGNHEFDRGMEDFEAKAQRASWQYLAANMDGIPEAAGVKPYVINTIDGVDVAFIGAITEELPSLISPSILAGVTINPIATTVNSIADQLKDGDDANGEADVVVALVHEDPSLYESSISQKVDLLFGGHSHLLYNNGKDEPTIVMQSAKYGEYVSQVKVTVAADGTTSFEPTQIPLQKISDGVGVTDTCSGTVAEQVRSEIVAAEAYADEKGSEVLGYISGDFNKAQGVDPADPTTKEESRGEESTVGNLVADAQLWAAKQTPAGEDATISLMNPGGLRTSLTYDPAKGGAITLGEAATMQPFGNTLFAMDLTGADLLEILNQQKQPADASRPYLKLGVSGLTYTIDPDTYEVKDVWLADGSALDPDATYRVVTNSFLKDGGDNFFSFTKGTRVQDTGLIDLDVFNDFMGEMAPKDNPLDPNGPVYGVQRSWGVKDVTVPADGIIETGDTIGIDFSGLWFTTNETSNVDTVTVWLGGEKIGEAPVSGELFTTNALTEKYPNYGQAEVNVTIPDLSRYSNGTTLSFEVKAGDTVLTSREYTVAGVTPSPTASPTAEPTSAAPSVTPSAVPSASPSATPSKPLPNTGADTRGLLAIGLLLLGVGATAAVARKKSNS